MKAVMLTGQVLMLRSHWLRSLKKGSILVVEDATRGALRTAPLLHWLFLWTRSSKEGR